MLEFTLYYSSPVEKMASRKFQDLNGYCSKVEGALSDLRQFLAIESPLKLWKMLFISPQKLFSF